MTPIVKIAGAAQVEMQRAAPDEGSSGRVELPACLETNRHGPHQNDPGRRLSAMNTARQSLPKVRFAIPDAFGACGSELYLLASGFRMV
jgi:hypothetical protein